MSIEEVKQLRLCPDMLSALIEVTTCDESVYSGELIRFVNKIHLYREQQKKNRITERLYRV